MREHIPDVVPGQPVSAAHQNALIQLAARGAGGPSTLVDNTGTYQRRPADAEAEERWFELQANLAADGSANAYILNWMPNANSGNGQYQTDSGTTYTIRDTTGQNWGLHKEWLRCREIRSTNGAVWEVMRPGAPWHEVTLSAQLNQGSTANATLTIRSTSVTVTVTDRFLGAGENIATSTTIGIEYDVVNKRWVATEAPC